MIAALLAGLLTTGRAWAEATEIRFAQQFSMGYLEFNVMKHLGLLEKHLAAAGLPPVKVTYVTFNGPDMMNDALLSGSIDIASGGVPGLLTIWSKTWHTNQEVRGISALSESPILLNSRNPKVHAITDLTSADRIALPAVKVAIQAALLEMAAARQWGDASYDKLDALTFSLSPPDATAGLLSGSSDFNAAFTVPPYQEMQLKDPAVHTILSSYDVIGPSTGATAWTSKKFHDDNPKLYRALVDAMQEASDYIPTPYQGNSRLLRGGLESQDRHRPDGKDHVRSALQIHPDPARHDQMGRVHAQGRPHQEHHDELERSVLARNIQSRWVVGRPNVVCAETSAHRKMIVCIRSRSGAAWTFRSRSSISPAPSRCCSGACTWCRPASSAPSAHA